MEVTWFWSSKVRGTFAKFARSVLSWASSEMRGWRPAMEDGGFYPKLGFCRSPKKAMKYHCPAMKSVLGPWNFILHFLTEFTYCFKLYITSQPTFTTSWISFLASNLFIFTLPTGILSNSQHFPVSWVLLKYVRILPHLSKLPSSHPGAFKGLTWQRKKKCRNAHTSAMPIWDDPGKSPVHSLCFAEPQCSALSVSVVLAHVIVVNSSIGSRLRCRMRPACIRNLKILLRIMHCPMLSCQGEILTNVLDHLLLSSLKHLWISQVWRFWRPWWLSGIEICCSRIAGIAQRWKEVIKE